MSRVLKFRAWDGDKMHYAGMERMGDFHEYLDHPIMQFTGLLDSKGMEIYEGDVVRKEYKHHVGMAEVRYDPNFAGYHPFVYNGGGEYEPDDCEVIGNIHQHPELLD